MSEAEHVDLATIPFHLRFQQLVDLFGAANDDALATVISRFQTRAVSSGRYEKLSPEERKILRRAGVALSELADARRAFNQLDSEKLRKERRSASQARRNQPVERVQGRLDLSWILRPVVSLKLVSGAFSQR